ncbi:hypothetical protein OG216_41920 [Streptomycetaceae bacterium NBC_01309]
MLPGFVLMGLGGALRFPPLMGVAVGVVPPERAGMASGATNMFFPPGTSVGVAAAGAADPPRPPHGGAQLRVRVRVAV